MGYNTNMSILYKYIKFICAHILILVIITMTSSSIQASNSAKLKQLVWPFEGIFGKFDRQAAQRGLKVYTEVCSSCHGLSNLYYRNLKSLGFSEEEIVQFAKDYKVLDGPNEDGEMFERPALPSDHFVSPYPNQELARLLNNGAFPVDLSLIVKARPDGANYIFSLLTGYTIQPSNFEVMEGLYYNLYFPGQQIAMPPPLVDNQVEYIDGTVGSVEQMAKDVTIFLQWAAEPEMEDRKSLGIKVIIFIIIFSIFSYIAKNRIWQDVK